jgi:Zn-dependent protease with chaperone function
VIAAICLLGYTILLMAAAPMLARARWPDRAPRLALAAWFSLAISAVSSVMLGGFALLVPTERISMAMARLLASCADALRAAYSHPGGRIMAGAGAATVLLVAARVAWCAVANIVRMARSRHAYRIALRLAGHTDHALNAVVLDHPQPAAWCLPETVVLTSRAVATLDTTQVAAVLAHERRHQQGHHHLLVSMAGSLASAFPRLPAFRLAYQQVARLTELLADDAAVAASHRLAVAEALLVLSARPAGVVGALGAGGSSTAARIRRLIADPAPLSRAAATGVLLGVISLAAMPLAMLVGPAIAASCPPPPSVAASRLDVAARPTTAARSDPDPPRRPHRQLAGPHAR